MPLDRFGQPYASIDTRPLALMSSFLPLLNCVVSEPCRFGKGFPPIQIAVGPRYWIDTFSGRPDKFGLWAVLTVLLSK